MIRSKILQSLVFIVLVALGVGVGFELGRGSVSADPQPPVDPPRMQQVAGTPGAVAPGVAAGLATAARFDELTTAEQRDIAIFGEVSPSVVYISNIALRRDFFSLNVFEIPRGTGSGFLWDDEGHVVTNYHVISTGNRFRVTFGGEDYNAQLIGAAPNKDLAVLRIQAPRQRLRPIRLGRSDDLMVGQRVLAVGNPFGLDQTLTTGIVSALGRELDSPGGLPIRDVIQIDAAINPGNSGGPLLDSRGLLIGVNTAIYSPTGASAGIGFAVPVDTVRRLVPQLIEHGRPVQAGIGVELVPDRWAARLGVRGVIVREVNPRGPAARAGIEGLQQSWSGDVRLGDVIVAVGGEPIATIQDLILAFEDLGVGAQARITVERDGRERSVDVELIALE